MNICFSADLKNKEFNHDIHTESSLAQQYFNLGLLQYYAYDNEQALKYFQKAITHDPNCAMCHWGIALSLIIPYHTPLKFYQEAERNALGLKHAQLANQFSIDHQLEHAYATTILAFYENAKIDTVNRKKKYSQDMQQLMENHPEDIDAAVLTAGAWMSFNQLVSDNTEKAGMQCHTYQTFWYAGGAPRKYTQHILNILQTTLQACPLHPGANHYFIHLLEASATPELGLNSAKILEKNDYSIGHFAHMPSHIYHHLGEYRLAIESNRRALEIDEKHLKMIGERGTNYEAFYTHDLLFLIHSLSMASRGNEAVKTSNKLVNFITDKSFVSFPILTPDAFDYLLASPLLVMVRFNQWQDIVKILKPGSQYPFALSMWHYARGLSFASLNKIKLAKNEINALQEVEAKFSRANNNLKLVTIAKYHLQGKLAQIQNQTPKMIQFYQAALQIENSLPYSEPSPWLIPMRQVLAYAYLQEKQFQLAKTIFQEDLILHPKNPWSLYGLTKALQFERDPIASQVKYEFNIAAKKSDMDFSKLLS